MWLLLIPPAALLLALLWTALRGRPKRAREAMLTIEGYRRSMDALARPVGSASDDPGAHAVYPGDLVRERAPAERAGDASAPRPAEPPRAAAVVPLARAVASAPAGEPADAAEPARRPAGAQAPVPRGVEPARPASRRE